jgi:DNA polymerase-3 subunit gamma/tau
MPHPGRRGSAAPAASATPRNEPVPRRNEAALPARVVERFEDLIGLAAEKRDLAVKSALERDVRLVHFEDGKIEIALEASARSTLVGELSKKLSDWTGRRWVIVVSAEVGAPTLRAQADMRKAELENDVRGNPLVQAVLAHFPGAQIIDVRPPVGAAGANAEELSGLQPGDGDVIDDDR